MWVGCEGLTMRLQSEYLYRAFRRRSGDPYSLQQLHGDAFLDTYRDIFLEVETLSL